MVTSISLHDSLTKGLNSFFDKLLGNNVNKCFVLRQSLSILCGPPSTRETSLSFSWPIMKINDWLFCLQWCGNFSTTLLFCLEVGANELIDSFIEQSLSVFVPFNTVYSVLAWHTGATKGLH